MPACKRLTPALPVLTYFKYAPLRFSVSSFSTRPDLNLNTP